VIPAAALGLTARRTLDPQEKLDEPGDKNHPPKVHRPDGVDPHVPGERAIEKMLEVVDAHNIRRMMRSGMEPAEAMVTLWGRDGVRDRIKRSQLTLLEKLTAMAALDNWEARQAAVRTTAQNGATPYRSMTVRSVPQPAGKGRLKRFVARAWVVLRGLPARLRLYDGPATDFARLCIIVASLFVVRASPWADWRGLTALSVFSVILCLPIGKRTVVKS
jgi:hypothetical protein